MDDTTLVTLIYNCLKGRMTPDEVFGHATHLIHCQYEAEHRNELSYHALHVVAMTQAAQALAEAQYKIDEENWAEYSRRESNWLDLEKKA